MNQIAGAIVLLIAAKIILNLFMSPADAVRAELEEALAQVPARAPLSGGEDPDFAALCNPILDKPSLWHEVVGPPPAAPRAAPAAPPVPAAPDVAGMLKDLGMAPGQIGEDKMRVIPPGAPDGAWMAVGDTFNGCTLESFTREEAVFSYYWKEGDKVLTVAIERPLR